MAGGPTLDALPQSEAILDRRISRAIAGRYGQEAWTVDLTPATRNRRGLPDRLYIVRGRPFAFELKAGAHRASSSNVRPRQRSELAALQRAGATVAFVTTARQALRLIHDRLKDDPPHGS